MSAALISMLISHILTFLESELMKEEPALVAALVHDVQSLILKLQGLISSKLPAEAPALNSALKVISLVASDAVQAAGSVVVSDMSTTQSVE